MISEWFQFLRTQGESDRYTVLVASDDVEAAAALGSTLEQNNYLVGSTASLTEMLPMLDTMTPDVLICDFVHPEIDGKNLLEAARLRLGKSGMPAVLFLRDSQEDETLAHTLGVDDLILKPFDPQLLLERIAQLVSERSTTRIAPKS